MGLKSVSCVFFSVTITLARCLRLVTGRDALFCGLAFNVKASDFELDLFSKQFKETLFSSLFFVF